MATIKSGVSTDQWTIDPVSKAGRVTLYDASGNPLTSLTVSVANFPVVQNVGVVIFPVTQNVSGVFWPVVQDVQELSANLGVTATGASGAAVTATLPAVAGQSHYITLIEIVKYAAAAITGTATPVVVTSTNLPGALAWTFETAAVIGSQVSKVFVPAKALKSLAQNTPTTIVCPATTNVIWRVNVWYLAL